jgi:hypothetical protein
MNVNRDKMLENSNFFEEEQNNLPLKMAQKTPPKYPVCQ